jgi:hypothetical protein
MMMKRFPTFLAVLIVLAIVCQDSSVSAKDAWTSIRSKNFSLIGNVSEMLKRALRISPGRNDFTFMLAQVCVRKEDYKLAHQLLDQLNTPNVDEAIRQQAQALLGQLASMEEQKSRFETMRRSSGSNSPGATGFGGSSEVTEPVAQTPSDPSSELRTVLRKPEKGETQLQATLVRIDCDAKGIVFVVKTGDRLLRLKTDKFEHVVITTYSPDVAGDITCGPRKPENAVIVCFIPSTETSAKTAAVRSKKPVPATKTDGLIRSLEFVPKEFKLKAQPGNKQD